MENYNSNSNRNIILNSKNSNASNLTILTDLSLQIKTSEMDSSMQSNKTGVNLLLQSGSSNNPNQNFSIYSNEITNKNKNILDKNNSINNNNQKVKKNILPKTSTTSNIQNNNISLPSNNNIITQNQINNSQSINNQRERTNSVKDRIKFLNENEMKNKNNNNNKKDNIVIPSIQKKFLCIPQNSEEINTNFPQNSNNIKKYNSESLELQNHIITNPNKSVAEILKLSEERIKKLKEQKEKEDQRQKILEQNRAYWRQRMRKVKDFITLEKKQNQNIEDFFQKNMEFFSNYGITKSKDLQKFLDLYENGLYPEDEPQFNQILKKNTASSNLENIKEENENLNENEIEKNSLKFEAIKTKPIIEVDNFKEMITISPTKIKPLLKIQHSSEYDFQEKPKTPKYFSNELSKTEENCINIPKTINKIANLEKSCHNEIDYYFTPDTNEIKLKKLKKLNTYQITSNISNSILNQKIKYKYPENELFISSNEVNIFYKNIPRDFISIGGKISENFEMNNENINNKNKLKNNNLFSSIKKYNKDKEKNTKYQKNIITNLDQMTILRYELGNPNIPFDESFLDVLCTNCYECVKYQDMDKHSEHCVIKLNEFNDNLYEEDYNIRLYKLHESLKNKKNEIYTTENQNLINFYNELLSSLYGILINNNSIEELNFSIKKINENFQQNLEKFSKNYKMYFLLFCQRISQLIYMKLKDMEKIFPYNEDDKDSLLDELESENYQEESSNSERINYMKKQLSNIESQTKKAADELKQWKKEAKMLENNLKYPQKNKNELLSDITSEINSNTENVDLFTSLTGQISEIGDNFGDNKMDMNSYTEEEKKKYFMSMGLELKFKYGQNNSIDGENYSIADLYNKAKENNIKPDEYQNFLIKELDIKLPLKKSNNK